MGILNATPFCARSVNGSHAGLGSFCGDETAHPLELGLRLHHAVSETRLDGQPAGCSTPSLLARAMCRWRDWDCACEPSGGALRGRRIVSLIVQSSRFSVVHFTRVNFHTSGVMLLPATIHNALLYTNPVEA